MNKPPETPKGMLRQPPKESVRDQAIETHLERVRRAVEHCVAEGRMDLLSAALADPATTPEEREIIENAIRYAAFSFALSGGGNVSSCVPASVTAMGIPTKPSKDGSPVEEPPPRRDRRKNANGVTSEMVAGRTPRSKSKK